MIRKSKIEYDDKGILYDFKRDGPVGFNDLVVVYADGTSKRFNKAQYERQVSRKNEAVINDGTKFKAVRVHNIRSRPSRNFKHRAASTRRSSEYKKLPSSKVQCTQPGLFN